MVRMCTYKILRSKDTTEVVKCKSFIWIVRIPNRVGIFFRPVVENGSGTPFMACLMSMYIFIIAGEAIPASNLAHVSI
jgi:hypothetical protein